MSEPHRKDEIAGEIIHVYDGIEEADNELPLWWIFMFVGGAVFALGYWFAYHEYQALQLPLERYEAAVAARAEAAGTVDPSAIVRGASNPETLAAGQAVFTANCVACHAAQGEGLIGPNLTDDAWIHGGSALAVYTVIKDGVLTKGMPSWGPVLGDKAAQQVASYVLAMRGKNVPGKAAEGTPWSGAEDEPAK